MVKVVGDYQTCLNYWYSPRWTGWWVGIWQMWALLHVISLPTLPLRSGEKKLLLINMLVSCGFKSFHLVASPLFSPWAWAASSLQMLLVGRHLLLHCHLSGKSLKIGHFTWLSRSSIHMNTTASCLPQTFCRVSGAVMSLLALGALWQNR